MAAVAPPPPAGAADAGVTDDALLVFTENLINTVSTTQATRATNRAYSRNVPEDQLLQAFKCAAIMVAEATGDQMIIKAKGRLTNADFARYVAALFPGPNLPPATAPRHVELLDEAFGAYSSTPHAGPAGLNAATAAAATLTVTTAAEKELEDRQIKICAGRIKCPNFSKDGCWDAC